MGGGWERRLGPAVQAAPGARVDRFEVFFDLVYVFSFFIIARATAADLSARGLLHAVLLLAVLWWCWVVHSLVANRIRLGEGFVPLVMALAIVALFAFALASPRAFRDPAVGLPGPLVIACSYLVIRLVHYLVYRYAIRKHPQELRKIRPYAVELSCSTALLFVAALAPPQLGDPGAAAHLRDGIWILLVLFQYATPLLTGARGWVVTSAEHLAERYDLILMIALGESLISVGVGSDVVGRPITWRLLLAAAMGIVGIYGLWWLHFDLIAPASRLALHGTHGRARIRLVRDAYADLYLVMLVGIVIFALGGEEMLHQVGSPHVGLSEPVHGPGMALLYAGTICFLVGDLLFQLRTLGTVSWTRVGAVVTLGVLVPLAVHLPILLAVAVVATVTVLLVAVEAVVFAGPRRALHAALLEERVAQERHETAWRRPRTRPDEASAG
ncbi:MULTISPECIES: low temperature requirement protein A [Micromonospora]|uniref:Low temperature requirement protein A n=1 Tax=Micromonospora solifontis TaxID=2487138 RepID=A0ABX9WJD3_9ACTN|nr:MULTISPECIES: low temperature requirement protein A [Micromonospora]NES12388.1 low temperature requirement protein A [Micromonospora sp. PPF5-17B]NES37160.1 low temperature requirement protein A [Micromonospora solifontis]NES54129.1 low temperature requirement protein A [Micromonospora sp. PPF5-6]RNL98712.1 low temperature requirement protein A [Micromonospora solifontis]